MFIISAVLGAKYYPIPYRWDRLAGIGLTMGAVYGVSLLIDSMLTCGLVLKLVVHTGLIITYMAGAWMIIRKR